MDISKINSIDKLKVVLADAFIGRENAQAELKYHVDVLNAGFARLEELEKNKAQKASTEQPS